MLEIHSNYSKQFNEYLIKKIKADLKQSAFFFNPVFLYHGELYTLDKCINSLTITKNIIHYKLYLQVKYLIYNNRQLFWLEILNYYSKNINREYLLWKGRVANLKTMSDRLW